MAQLTDFVTIGADHRIHRPGDSGFQISFAVGGLFPGTPPPSQQHFNFSLQESSPGASVVYNTNSVLIFTVAGHSTTEMLLTVLINGSNQIRYRIPAGSDFTRSINEVINPDVLQANPNRIEFRIGPSDPHATTGTGSVRISDIVIFYKLNA